MGISQVGGFYARGREERYNFPLSIPAFLFEISLKNRGKSIDAGRKLWYIMNYLSAERFIFCAHFSGARQIGTTATGRQCLGHPSK